MPRKSYYDEDDFDYDDDHDDVRRVRRPREDKEYDKKKSWERETQDYHDDYDRR